MGTYTCPLKGVFSNDLEWVSELNDTKHRAASLRQLSFLSLIIILLSFLHASTISAISLHPPSYYFDTAGAVDTCSVHSRLDYCNSVFLKLSWIAFSTLRTLSLVPLLQLLGLSILTRFSNRGSRYRSALKTMLFPPHTNSSSLLLHSIFAISLPSSLRDPFDLPLRSLSYIHQLSLISRLQTDPIDMQHLTCGTVFRLLSVLLIGQLHHTALHHHPLIYNWLFTRLMGFSILVSKLKPSPRLFLHNLHSLRVLIPCNIDIQCFEVSAV